MRTVYLVRHGLSEANNRENIGTPAFGASNAELMPEGIEHAKSAGNILVGRFALLQTTHTATSTMLRTQQTAKEAGFVNFTEYAALDEVPVVLDECAAERRARWRSGELDSHILNYAHETLCDAPPEQIWFTHGLRIAGICRVLEQYQDKRTIPYFGEVRAIELSSDD